MPRSWPLTARCAVAILALAAPVAACGGHPPPRSDEGLTPVGRSPLVELVWSSDGGAQRLLAPAGLAVDGQGTLVVVDAGADQLVRLAGDTGQVLGSWGGRGGAAGQFRFAPPPDPVKRELTLTHIYPGATGGGRLGGAGGSGPPPTGRKDDDMRGREDVAEWAVSEFGAADLGDDRRTLRLVQLATVLGDHPSASLPDACADPATLKAAYRFFDTDAITPDAMLTSHVRATYARLAAVPVVLAVNDTTLLDWSHHPATADLGPLATRHQQGLLVHSTLTFTPERAALGLLGQYVWARDPATYGRLADRHARPIDEKESVKWLHSLAAINAAAAACPATHFVQVGDAEADVYDLFVAARAANVDLLVRAGQDRRVEQADRSLRAAIRRAPLASEVEVALPRQGERRARRATLAVRFRAVTLRPPGTRAGEHLPAAALWAVWAEEVGAPPGAEPVAWLLLTTCPVTSAAEAEERLRWYACRWGIEVWHKVLKSGCQIEARQLASRDRLARCLTLYSVIAWRVVQAVLLARALPALPCTALLEADEWQALWCAIHRSPTPPARPPTLQEAVRWLGRLGGHPGRTRDGEPGVTVLWKGFQHLADLATMYRIMKPSMRKEEVGKG